jgi:hypothetical protein
MCSSMTGAITVASLQICTPDGPLRVSLIVDESRAKTSSMFGRYNIEDKKDLADAARNLVYKGQSGSGTVPFKTLRTSRKLTFVESAFIRQKRARSSIGRATDS